MDASGWGFNTFNQKFPDKLWTVKQQCLDADNCANTTMSGKFDRHTMICVGDEKTPQNSACRGDSGGK